MTARFSIDPEIDGHEDGKCMECDRHPPERDLGAAELVVDGDREEREEKEADLAEGDV
jgi:hypothetical protein